MSIDFDSKPTYDDKRIKSKIRTFEDSIITNFHDKKVAEEKILIINNNARFCSLCILNISSSNVSRRIQI